MTKFPEEMDLTIVDGLFDNYTIGYETGDGEEVLVYCETCDGVACVLETEDVSDISENDFYELIVDEHRKQVACD